MPIYATVPSRDISSNKVALKTVQTKIATVGENLDQLQAQQQKLQQQLVELDKKAASIAASIKDFDLQIEENNKLIHNTERSIQQQTQRIRVQKNSLNKQLKAAYAVGRHDRLKLLLNQQDPALSSRILGYYDYLNKLRLTKLTQLEENIKLLQQLEKEHTEEIQRLQPLQQAKQVEQGEMLKLKQQRTALLAQLGKEIDVSKAELHDLHADERNLKTLISRLQKEGDQPHEAAAETVKVIKAKQHSQEQAKSASSEVAEAASAETENDQSVETDQAGTLETTNTSLGSAGNSNVPFASLKGRLPWPVVGKVLQPYGSSKLNGTTQGILIGANVGNPVKSIANGKVAYSGWLRGYGMLTIINHGNGYMSVYAFNRSLHKRVGAAVKAGEIIATVGQGGGQAPAGLYFEIRQQGNPLNPSAWCN